MKAQKKSFGDLFAKARERLAYHVEGAIVEFTEELFILMRCEGISKGELARRLGCKPAYITKLLSGQNNFTLETMVKTARALRAELKIHLQPSATNPQWTDVDTFSKTQQATSPSLAILPSEAFRTVRGSNSATTLKEDPDDGPALAA